MSRGTPRVGDQVMSKRYPDRGIGWITHPIDPNAQPIYFGVFWPRVDRSWNHRADDLALA